jgi:hypothetical protein
MEMVSESYGIVLVENINFYELYELININTIYLKEINKRKKERKKNKMKRGSAAARERLPRSTRWDLGAARANA